MKHYKIDYNYNLFGGSLQKKSRLLKKDFLIIIPAGDKSYHHQRSWYNSNIYDLYVVYYGSDDKIKDNMSSKSDFFIQKRGPKWQLVRHVLTTFDWSRYSYIWLPDDDLDIEKNKVEEFLLVSQSLKLELSQPSLRLPGVTLNEQINIINDWYKTNDNNNKYIGFYKYHQIKGNEKTELITQYISYKLLLQHYPADQKIVRYTNFVEIMCPLLSNKLLEKTYQWINYDDVQSGFGIDTLWPTYLNNEKIGVIDYISAIHTRPVGNFQAKKTGNFKVLTVSPEDEKVRSIKRSNLEIKNDFKQTLSEITLNKPKLAFLFMTKGDIRYPKIWEKFLKNQKNYNCYIHPKDKTLVKSFLKDHIISRIVETRWGDISLTKAMNSLLEEAYKNGENQKFIFLSESCLPIQKFDQLYSFLENLNKSVFTLGNGSGQHYERMKYLRNPKSIGLNRNNFYKSELWSILDRKHVQTILRMQKKFIPVFEKIRAPEEHFNVSTTLINHGLNSFIDKRTTFVHWPEAYSPHPTTFGPILADKDKELIKESRKTAFFARKFIDKDEKENNIEEFILELIK